MSDAHEAFLATRTGGQRLESTKRWSTSVRDFWGHRRVDEITPAVFREFYTHRRNVENIKEHTLKKDVSHIRQILKHCVETGTLSTLPFIPQLNKLEHNPRRWLELHEWKRLQAVS